MTFCYFWLLATSVQLLPNSSVSASSAVIQHSDGIWAGNVVSSAFSQFVFFFLQLKSGGSLLGVSFGGWPSGVLSPSLPLCSSPSPMPGHSLEGNTAASVSSKSESPLPRIEKSSSMPSPALEMPKSLDHPSPRPIPEGGWRQTEQIDLLFLMPPVLVSLGSF